MEITKQLKTEILQVMEEYWNSYFRGDLQTWANFLPDDYRNIGTTEAEIWNSKKEIVDFTESVLDQTVGMAELREKKTQIIPYAPYIMVHELGDLYVKSTEGWIYYASLRLSSLLEKTHDGWKILHQHGSYPDSKTGDGEAFGFDQLKIENKKLRDAIKSRTLELERKNRELEIEAALERVRARTMAMQQSDELGATSLLLFNELRALGKISKQISIGIFDENNQVLNLYATVQGEQWSEVAKIDLDEPQVMQKIHAAWRQKKSSIRIDLIGDELQAYNRFRTQFSSLEFPEERWVIHAAFFSKGVLTFSTTTPHDEATMRLLERFAQMFDGTYTRFLDLQKAEAQAREAQIEAALERVRSRSMAMHSSSEMVEVADVMFQELRGLGDDLTDNLWGCGVVTCQTDSDDDEIWFANENGVLPPILMPHTEDPYHKRMYEGWEKKLELYSEYQKGAALKEHYAYMLSVPKVKTLFEDILASGLSFPSWQKWHAAYFSQGYLLIITTKPYEEERIFTRFARVFDQAYTRFLDLQKAEAQAREAQIEAALERVRSRTMGMQKSAELGEVIQVLNKQLVQLDILVEHAGFIVDYKTSDNMHIWLADEHGAPARVTIPYFDSPHWNSFLKAKEKGKQFFANQLDFEEKNRFYEQLFSYIPDLPDALKEYYFNCPGLAISTVLMDNIGLYIENFSGIPYSEEENDILLRFGKVFQQAYTRFLDLEKAEAQAREAQVETALEKVRSRTMGMQKSDELPQAANLLFEQIQSLGLPTWSTAFNIFAEDQRAVICNVSSEGQLQSSFRMPLTKEPSFLEWYEAIQRGDPIFVQELGGKELEQHYEYLFTLPGVKDAAAPLEEEGIALPTYQVNHICPFQYGFLLFITYETVPGALEIFQRFAKVFEQTYTRFLDLQNAEAQAREAQIEAALERVRSRSMAMHKSDEIQEVANTTFHNLHNLGIDTDTITILIPIQGTKDFEVWIQNTNRNYSSKKLMPYHDHKIGKAILEAWQNKREIFTALYNKKEKDSFFNFFFAHPKALADLAEDRKRYVLEGKGYALSVSFNTHTGMQMGRYNGEAFSAADNNILQRFSKVFEQTYTRFLDLQTAEAQAREAQIEAALERIRAQSMTMQHSRELSTTSHVFHEQLIQLGLPTEFSYVWLPDEASMTHMFWTTWSESKDGTVASRSQAYTYPLDKTEPYTAACFEMWESDEDVFVNPISPEEVEEFFSSWSDLLGEARHMKLENFPEGLYYAEAYMKYGCFGINIRRAPDEAEQEVLHRFAIEFERTYTRFLDLQKAEEQARRIQLVNRENERLLHSILPQPIVEQIRSDQKNVVKRFDQVSILFADIVGFTVLSEKLQPGKVVDILNGLFSRFDDLTDKYGLEKIKTIGDAYMVAAGVPEERSDHATVIFAFARDMLQALREYNQATGSDMSLRIGISSGPVIAGVIGKKKFAYDLWGDSVNTAARMEAYGQAGRIQVSPESYELLKQKYPFEKIPAVNIKGKGIMDVYLWTPNGNP